VFWDVWQFLILEELAVLCFYPPEFAAASPKVLDLQKSAKDFDDLGSARGGTVGIINGA
jgi:hypothetical protein